MAQRLYGPAIVYSRVRVHGGRFLPGAGGYAMAPWGHLYFPTTAYCADFSQASDTLKVWFMHEMAHVWQHQQGLRVWRHGLSLALRGAYRANRAYHYDAHQDAGKRLCDFNIEQQGDILAHYFDARFLTGGTGALHAQRLAQLPFYERVLAPFLQDPCAGGLLP